MKYGCKAETSEPRGIRWERREKNMGASGESRPKWPKIVKIFQNFVAIRWKWLQIWWKFSKFFKKNRKFLMFLSIELSVFSRKISNCLKKRGAFGDITHFLKKKLGLWVRLWKIWGLWVRAMLKNGGLNSLTYASPLEWECPPGSENLFSPRFLQH